LTQFTSREELTGIILVVDDAVGLLMLELVLIVVVGKGLVWVVVCGLAIFWLAFSSGMLITLMLVDISQSLLNKEYPG
jgi:hypothetical protein